MSDLRTYECRDCGNVYADTRGDQCPDCGGADVLLTTLNVDTSVSGAAVTTSALRVESGRMQQLAGMLASGASLTVDRLELPVGDKVIVFEAEDGKLKGTIEQEHQ